MSTLKIVINLSQSDVNYSNLFIDSYFDPQNHKLLNFKYIRSYFDFRLMLITNKAH